MTPELEFLLRDGGGVIRIRDHPRQARAAQRLAERGELARPLPGIYCHAGDADRVEVRIRAASLWLPDAVITGPAAAWLSFWPEIAVPLITLSLPVRRPARAGYRLCQERLPDELIVRHRGCWITRPALTALDLVPWAGGNAIDEVLRTNTATLDDLRQALALTANRAGNGLRRAALRESRHAPWSEAERLLHRMLRRADIRGWSGNVIVECAGERYPVDVVFRYRRLIIEVDGYAFHRAEHREQFHRDRRKWSNLTADGWTVLHFTWDHLVYEPAWVVAKVRQAMEVSSERLNSNAGGHMGLQRSS
ncbi:DUF559 domain-containing protein [Microlunatus sp. GCM10028923]|uniref:DUF559 domain-containing protein n=1 Tax=Microlunatus sp. GCM10028923 TaxID=3273400 RepID=UPI003607BC29